MNIRLAIISHQSLLTLGGVSIHIKQLVKALHNLGVELEVITPTSVNNGLTHKPYLPFHVTAIPVNNPLKTVKSLEYSYKVYKYLVKNKQEFDAVHASQWSSYFSIIYKKDINIPIITKFHGTTLYGTLCGYSLNPTYYLKYELGSLAVLPIYTHMETTIARRSDGLIFISKHVEKEVLMMTRGVLCGRTQVIYNGVDTKLFKPYGPSYELKLKYGE